MKRGLVTAPFPKQKKQKKSGVVPAAAEGDQPAPTPAKQGYCLAVSHAKKQCGWRKAANANFCKYHTRLNDMGRLPRGRIDEARPTGVPIGDLR